MNERDIQDHKIVSFDLDIRQLIEMIVDLSIERSIVSKFMSKGNLDKYDSIIDIYTYELNSKMDLNTHKNSKLHH